MYRAGGNPHGAIPRHDPDALIGAQHYRSACAVDELGLRVAMRRRLIAGREFTAMRDYLTDAVPVVR
jgi:hypothetical protein